MKKTKTAIADIDYMVKHWDFEKNTCDIYNTSVHLEEKAFWHCKICGYKWSASIKSRYSSSGLCPCHESNKVIKKGVNDVLALVPELAAEYDFENNPNVDIYREGVDSQKYVNWKCKKCGKSWSTRLGARIIKENDGYTFHRCTHYNTMKRKSIPVISEVSYMIKFWDFENNSLDPYVTKSNSHEYANWKCPNCSYSWSTQILTREQGSGKCPCCETFKVFVPGINDAISIIPELEKWFDKEKNKDIDIHSLRIRDTKTKYHWKCPDCGNSFYSSVASRIGGKMGSYSITRCKQCYINILSSNISPISSNPDMIKFWDYDKNIGCDTNLISCNSTDSYHWKCKKCTYEWEQTPHNRRNSKYCPCCEKGKAIAKGVNDLFTLYPELAEIYDPNNNPGLDIYSIGKGYPKDITWNCPDCGRKWNSTIKLRIKKDVNGNEYVVKCSHCNRKQIRALSYAEEYPHLKEMWDEKHNGIPFEKVNSTLSTKQSFHWNCPQCGNKFDAWLNHMIEKYDSPDRGCFYCSGYLVDPKRTSLQAKYPKIAAQWSDENEDTPDQVFPTLTVLRKWHCDIYNLEYQAPINEMVTGEKECPYCSGKLAVPGRTSLLALYPDIARMWSANNEKDADYVLPNVLTDALWICLECGNEFWGKIKEVVDGEDDCPYCNGTKIDPNRNSLRALFPQIAYKWSKNNASSPESTSPDSTAFVKWDCDICGNEYGAAICDMVSGDADCPYCNLRKVIPDKTSLKALHPEIAFMWSDSNDRQSDQVFPESPYIAVWNCPDCHYEYNAKVCDMVSGNADCPYCNLRKVIPEKTSLKALHPEIAFMWSDSNDRQSDQVFPESSYMALWNCPDCHYEYNARVCDMVSGNADCPYCNNRKVMPGFNSFEVRHKDLIEEWDYVNNYIIVDPNTISDNHASPVWWICKNNKNHHYPMSVARKLMYQKRNRESCPYCKGLRVKKRHFI